jgi:hypothetical protein
MKLTERDWLEQVKLAAKIYKNAYPNQTKNINQFIDYMFEIYGYAHERLTEGDE